MGADPVTDQLPESTTTAIDDAAGVPSDNTTLVDVMASYQAAGFTTQFGVTPEALVRCFHCDHTSEPSAIELVSLRRLEGASDPDDMIAVVALRCPSCHAAGVLALGYGPDSAPEEGEVLLHLEDSRGADNPSVPAHTEPGDPSGRTQPSTKGESTAMEHPIRVALVNDYEVVIAGVRSMLEPYANRIVIVDAPASTNGNGYHETSDVTLFDTYGRTHLGTDELRRLAQDPRMGRVVVYSIDEEADHVQAALGAGAAGYISKAAGASDLASAIEAVASAMKPGTRRMVMAAC